MKDFIRQARTWIVAHPGVIFAGTFLSFSTIFYFLQPETIISYVGVENAYVFMAILAFIGGVSTFSGVPYQLVLVSLASGGLNPWLLGLVTGISVMIGDSTSYFVGKKSRDLISAETFQRFEFIERLYARYPKSMPAIFLAYGSLCPLPNDVLTIPLGILGYPFWRMIIPLAIGNIIFNIGLSLLAVYAYDYLAFLG